MFETVGVLFQKIGVVIGTFFISISGSIDAPPAMIEPSQPKSVIEEFEQEYREAASTSTKYVSEQENQIDVTEHESISPNQEDRQYINPTSDINSAPIVVDMCLNLEGTQEVLPAGYIIESNVCVLEKDYCPNVPGVQTIMPEDMFYYKRAGDCYTEREIEELENQESEATMDLEVAETIEKEVITLTSQGVGEWVERSEDLNKTVTLAIFDVYAKNRDLDGTTFRALIRGVSWPDEIKFVCPDIIKIGETKSCRIKISNINRSGLNYKITDVIIEAFDGVQYKNKFPAVEGYIADR